jgi:general secretion pathway protein D
LNNLANLNATNFAVTVGQATANLLLSDSDTKVLQNPSIRASDGQKADLKIGQRIPVATGSYQTGAATAIVSSLVNTQFTYLDVGVEIEITPIVHYDHDVTLKIKLVSSQEAGQTSIGGITEPIISQRTAEQTVRLKEGEVNILGGYIVKQDLLSVGGTPGLGELPILKYFFSSQQHQKQDDEIVFMLTPHIVRGTDITPQNLREIDTGTGSNIQLRRIDMGTVNKPAPLVSNETAAASAVPAQPVNPALPQPPSGPRGPRSPLPPAVPAPAPGANTLGAQSAPSGAMQISAPAAPEKVGSTFQVAINMNGGRNVYSVPMMLHYDSSKLTLMNVDSGDFLGHDGQAVALVHRDDGSGMVVVSASRPPGAAGINGAGSVCILTFQAKTPGDSSISIVRASIKNSTQQSSEITGSQAWVHIVP